MKNSHTDIPKYFIEKWQEIANLLAVIIKIPAALIMKTENEFVEVFISSLSESNPYHVGDKENWHGLYCETVIKSQQSLRIPNALIDEKWKKNPDVNLGMIAYLGYPIYFPNKKLFGTICVLDNKENHFSSEHEQLLLHFKNVIELDLALFQSIDFDAKGFGENGLYKLLDINLELQIAKEKAEESELKFQGMLDNMLDALFQVDLKGNITYANPAALSLYRYYSLSELIGTPASKLYETEEDRTNLVRKLYEFKEEIKWDCNGLRKDGTSFCASIKAKVILDKNGNIIGTQAIVRDISERKKTESEIIIAKENAEESERKLQGILDNLQDSYFQADKNGNFTYVNQMAVRMYGFNSVEEMIGMPAVYLYADETERSVLIEKLAVNGFLKDYVSKGKRKDGSVFWVSLNVQYTYKNGQVSGTDGLVRDISQRKLAEENLEIQKNTLAAIFESTPFIMMLIREDGRIAKINNTGVNYTGLNEQDILYKLCGNALNCISAFGNDLCGSQECCKTCTVNSSIKKVFETGQSVMNEEALITVKENDCFKNILISANMVFQTDGKFVLISIVDITERKKIENELKQSKQLLIDTGAVGKVGGWSFNIDTLEQVWTEETYHIHELDLNYNPSVEKGINFYTLESRPIIAQAVQRAIEYGEPYDLDLEIITAKGNRRNVNAIGQADLQNRRIHGFFQDITERKKAEVELKNSENLLNKIFDVLPIGLWFADKNGKLIRGNPAGVKIWGAEPTVSIEDYGVFKARRLPGGEEIAPEDWALAHTISKGVTIEDELLEIDAFDGKKKIILNYTTPILDDHGDIQGAIIVNHNITERKQAEAVFKDIIDKNPMSIQILDMDGYPIQVNKAHYELFGVEIPADYSVINDPQLLKLGFGELFNRVKKGEVVSFPDSYYNVRDVNPSFPDSPVWVRALGFTLNDNNGKPEKIVLMHENITERKNAEALLNDIIENNPMSIQIVDKEGYTIQGNSSFIKLFGSIPPPDFSIFEDLKSKSPELEKIVNKVKNGEFVHLPDIYFNAHDALEEAPDNPLWIRALVFPLNTSGGKPERFVFMHENITESKIAQQELIKAKEKAEESENFFRNIFENSPVGKSITDMEGDIKTNKAFGDMLGYSFDEFQGKNLRDITHSEDIQKSLDAIDALLKEEKSVMQFEKRFIHKNGSIIFATLVTTLQKNSNGTPLFFLTSIMDITDRIKAEKELVNAKDKVEESEKQFRLLYENSPLGTYIALPDGSIISVNNTAMKILGSPSEEATKQINILNFPPLIENGYASNFSECVQTGNTISLSLLYKSNWGKLSYLSSYIVPLKNANGQVEKVYTIMQDITEQKNTEEELIFAKEKAEESDRLKTAFLANMSHEIRTPMNGILGFSSLLKEPGLSGEEQKNYISIIEKSGERMLNIITEIMDISKIESGQMMIHNRDTNVNEKMQNVFNLLKLDAENKKVNLILKSKIQDNNAIVLTDEEKLYSILTNLVKNAIKYTDYGFVEFGCDLITKNNNSTLQFFVKDTGIGIPENRQSAIFERFIQADIADVQARQGAGLGLCIAKAYVEMLGGQIWVESKVGDGSTFYFTLPYKNDNKSSKKIENTIASVEFNQVRNLKILIAEDDEASEILITLSVENYSREILKAHTGLEAIEMCQNHSDIDLILMDVQMPDLNGYEATRQIRQFNKDVVIIAQTAFALTGDREKAINAGCNDYISKPINRDFLKALIQKYFKN